MIEIRSDIEAVFHLIIAPIPELNFRRNVRKIRISFMQDIFSFLINLDLLVQFCIMKIPVVSLFYVISSLALESAHGASCSDTMEVALDASTMKLLFSGFQPTVNR